MPPVDGLPVPGPLRQVPPRAARPDPVEDPVDHHPVVIPPVPPPRVGRQLRLQPRPLRIGQVMSLQAIIIHKIIQADTDTLICKTRPRTAGRPRRPAAPARRLRPQRRTGSRSVAATRAATSPDRSGAA